LCCSGHVPLFEYLCALKLNEIKQKSSSMIHFKSCSGGTDFFFDLRFMVLYPKQILIQYLLGPNWRKIKVNLCENQQKHFPNVTGNPTSCTLQATQFSSNLLVMVMHRISPLAWIMLVHWSLTHQPSLLASLINILSIPTSSRLQFVG